MKLHTQHALLLLAALASVACSNKPQPEPQHHAITTEKLEPYSCGTIQRLNTKGGKAPVSGCDSSHAGLEVRVAYSADYFFYGPK